MAENHDVILSGDNLVDGLYQRNVPIGTLAEAQAEGLDVTAYPTCARPNPVTGVKGCPWFNRCIVSAKGKSGPKNYGVQIIKGKAVGGGFMNRTVDCMWIADQIERIEANKGSLHVIAEEGEEYELLTKVAVNQSTNEVVAVNGPNTKRKERKVKVRVEPWPRPGQNVEILQDMMRAETAQQEKERKRVESRERNLGLEVSPIDKRDAGKGKGRSASGGGGSEG